MLARTSASTIAPYDPTPDLTDSKVLGAARQGPSWHHLFGTTDQGTDVFAQAAILGLYDPDRSQTLRNLGDMPPKGCTT